MTSIPIGLAEAQAPRYTSYPTAPHFNAQVDGAVYRGWLEALPAAEPLSLYLHVPFCEQLCWYCGCHTAVANGYGRVAAYVALLRQEIALLAAVLGEGRPVSGLHWGGGTPTILSAADFTAVMAQLRAAFDFRPDAELAIEIDPRHLTAEKAAALAADLRPERISVFGYAHVPWMKKHQQMIDEAALPGAEARLAQAEAAERVLLLRGYRAVGLDHFALPDDPLFRYAEEGRLRRNFQGYTTDQVAVLLGLGVSAIGTLPEGYAQNDKDMVGYAKALQAGRLPVVRGIALTSEDRLRRDVIQAVMCDFAVDLRAQAVAHGRPGFDFSEALVRLKPLAAEGLVTLQGSKVAVTGDGRRAVRLIASCFDAWLGAAGATGGRYSKAV